MVGTDSTVLEAWGEEEDEIQGIPITPPSESGHTKSISLPATPTHWTWRGDAFGGIPAQWSRKRVSSMSFNPLKGETMPEREIDKSGGRKRCLQLDLRGVGDSDQGENAYHLGESSRIS